MRFISAAEVVRIEGKSYRQKEAEEREIARKAQRAARKTSPCSRKAASCTRHRGRRHRSPCRRTGRPNRRWLCSKACRPCARPSGSSTGSRRNRPGAISSCPTTDRRTSILTCRSDPRPHSPTRRWPLTGPSARQRFNRGSGSALVENRILASEWRRIYTSANRPCMRMQPVNAEPARRATRWG